MIRCCEPPSLICDVKETMMSTRFSHTQEEWMISGAVGCSCIAVHSDVISTENWKASEPDKGFHVFSGHTGYESFLYSLWFTMCATKNSLLRFLVL